MITFQDPDITAAYAALVKALGVSSDTMTLVVMPHGDAREPIGVWAPIPRLGSRPATLADALEAVGHALESRALESRALDARGGLRAAVNDGRGPMFLDRLVRAAHSKLLDTICTWERMTGADMDNAPGAVGATRSPSPSR